MTTIIRASYIPQVLPFVSTEAARYYLSGTFIHPCPSGQGVRIVATDGHIMGLFHDSEGKAESADIWPISKTLLTACKPNARADGGLRRWLVIGDGKAVVSLGADGDEAAQGVALNNPNQIMHQEFIIPIDGTFPDYARVIPSQPVMGAIGDGGFKADHYDPQQVARVVSPATWDAYGAQTKAAQPIAIYSNEIGEPAIVKISTRNDFFGILMPKRNGNTGNQLPGWYTTTAPEAEPAQEAQAA